MSACLEGPSTNDGEASSSAGVGRGRVRSPGAKIRLECFCVSRQPTYQPRGALDGDEVIIDTLKVTPNRYAYIRTVSSSGEENKILSVVNAYDFSHNLGRPQTFPAKMAQSAIERGAVLKQRRQECHVNQCH